MSAVMEKIMTALAELDTADRNFVRHYLDELDEKEDAEFVGEEDDPDFIDEINRRVESIRNGTAKLIPADEVFRQADELIQAMRQRAT